MSQYEKSFLRPKDYFKLSDDEQWKIDKDLGILDWTGNCNHFDDKCCEECLFKFEEYYDDI